MLQTVIRLLWCNIRLFDSKVKNDPDKSVVKKCSLQGVRQHNAVFFEVSNCIRMRVIHLLKQRKKFQIYSFSEPTSLRIKHRSEKLIGSSKSIYFLAHLSSEDEPTAEKQIFNPNYDVIIFMRTKILSSFFHSLL